ncbi:sulfotransferase domain-containing protein [Rhodobacter sp. JA431]|uniref:sulfotransferase family protein n=1 Tax=Rhodobacter sp. JA431 TaxID=570013 RepID=UPI000BDBFCB7|nr:sulfotransferase [Rhodobacter sp. JA431]SOB99878.1 sulfotransferase domain-containing protein [Rhodobacter sp. JA431]
MTQERFPDFFILGAPKCGTTSLFSWLQAHPDTYLPVKEPGFFSPDILELSRHPGAIRTLKQYLDRLCPPDAAGKMTGESTPKYLYSEAALRALSPHAGRIKLIVMLRNPVDLAIAMHAQNLRQGREREPNFERAWSRGPAALGDRLTDYRFWGQPSVHLARWRNAFPAEDIHVQLLEENMKNDPAAAHEEVLSFLGLAPHRMDSYAPQNIRKSYRSARLKSASSRARRSVYRALEVVGITPQGTGILRMLEALNSKPIAQTNSAASVRKELAKTFAEDVSNLARLLGRETLPWPDFKLHRAHRAETEEA